MLTLRGRRLFIACLFITTAGVVAGAYWSAKIPLLGLTLLIWFVVEWVVFTYRGHRVVEHLTLTRQVIHGDREVPAVWSRTQFLIRVTVTSSSSSRLPFVVVEDRVPSGFEHLSGSVRSAFRLEPDRPAVLEYVLRADGPGVLRFEGVSVRICDPCGFFYRRLFVRNRVEYLVLPTLTDDKGRQRADKRFNTLPPPGIHRLRRPGSGSELLDLRDYRPGDPPKMIAWKASARRDILITKEIESDVPVRCLMFLDASTGVRIGRPGTTSTARLAEIGAGIAQAATANRDLVGLTVFDEYGTQTVPPARTHLGTIRILRELSEAAAKPPDPRHADIGILSKYAYPLAQEVYPDLMAASVNSRPIGLFWRPISDSRWMWLLIAVFLTGIFLIPWPVPQGSVDVPGYGTVTQKGLFDTQIWWIKHVMGAVKSFWLRYKPETGSTIVNLCILMLMSAPILFLPNVIAVAIWLTHGAIGFMPNRMKKTAHRKQLCALYALLDGDGPTMIERRLNDDFEFASRTARFLLDHHVRVPLKLYDADGRPRFRGTEKAKHVATGILRCVTHARDNELYVVLIDAAELGADIEPLVKAAKLARARHHLVIVIVPWPEGLPQPEESRRKDREGAIAAAKPHHPDRVSIGGLVDKVLTARHLHGYEFARSSLVRAGAMVLRVGDHDPVRVVLERLDQIRGARIRK